MSYFTHTRRQTYRYFTSLKLASTLLASALLSTVVLTSTVLTAALPALAQRVTPAPGLTAAGMTFRQAMNLGYAASRQGDRHTALINFQRALIIRPGNSYAAAAADNMAYYIEYDRNAARQQAITQLESRLARAAQQKDWVCAATTLDQLTTYAEPNSLNQERLIGQRGDVSGLLDARMDNERWSTVCAAQRPVY